MAYKPRSLFGLIEEINQSLVLPHIQRPFVWSEEQMRRLFDSLMRSYPIQTFLFWRTKDEIKVRRFMDVVDWSANLHDLYDKGKSQQDVEKVFVLDGQQRLQTLYAIFSGSIKPEDGSPDLEAYLDITCGLDAKSEDGLLYPLRFSAAPLSLPFYRIRNLLGKDQQKNAEDIADTLNDAIDKLPDGTKEIPIDRQRRVRRNVSQVVSMLREEKHFWVEQLDGVANEYPYKKILDIFVRVNSGGTKLDSGDLMFAAMKEGWSEIEENVEESVDMLNGDKLSFDKGFVLKCLMVAHSRKADLTPEKFTDKEKGGDLLAAINKDWPQAAATFEQLRDFIHTELKIFSDKVIRSYYCFVPLFDFLFHNPRPRPEDRLLMQGYYYKSQLFNWYSAQTDNIIDALHGIVGKAGLGSFPLEEIKTYFKVSRRATVEFSPETLGDMRLRYIILNLIYVQRFGASPFNVAYKWNEPHIDHIYPRSLLFKQFSLPTEEINHIGNYRFVGAMDNMRKRAELPASYFSRLKKVGINIENHLLLTDVSKDPSLLVFDEDTYRDFRTRRTNVIYSIAKTLVDPELAVGAARGTP